MKCRHMGELLNQNSLSSNKVKARLAKWKMNIKISAPIQRNILDMMYEEGLYKLQFNKSAETLGDMRVQIFEGNRTS